jgi:hypothetical protein
MTWYETRALLMHEFSSCTAVSPTDAADHAGPSSPQLRDTDDQSSAISGSSASLGDYSSSPVNQKQSDQLEDFINGFMAMAKTFEEQRTLVK